MQFPHELFKAAGLGSTDIAALVGVTRITGYRWLQGGGVQVQALRDRVQHVSSLVQAAIDEGKLPDENLARLPAEARIKQVTQMLNVEKW